MTQHQLTALLTFDLDLAVENNAAWATSLVAFLLNSGFAIDVVVDNEEDAETFRTARADSNGTTRTVLAVGKDKKSAILEQAGASSYDMVLAQGFALCSAIAEKRELQTKLWSLIDNDPFLEDPLHVNDLGKLAGIAGGSKLILTGSSKVRAQIDSTTPAATSKTRLLPAFPPVTWSLDEPTEQHDTIFVNGAELLDIMAAPGVRTWVADACQTRNIPRIVVSCTNASILEKAQTALGDSSLSNYPGILLEERPFYASAYLSSRSIFLTSAAENSGNGFLSEAARVLGIPVANGLPPISSVNELTAWFNAQMHEATEGAHHTVDGWTDHFANDLPDYEGVPFRDGDPVKVLLAGADFKFAGDIVDMLVQRKDIELKVDLFEANAKPQPHISSHLLPWADVIIAEFASKNAIWYSQNVMPHQQLVVHLHGYELLQPWIEELNVENCARIVFASEFYKNKAIEMRGWPAEKLHVIPNSVNPGDLRRTKDSEARFHIGIVGIVPILKRPDRAIELLEMLLAEDERYVLHIKGHKPWDYHWEWKRGAHQDAYREFYARIARNPKLASRVAFEPFSPDMANWLTKIGWLLSPSTRETFHLSAIEGAASGAVPLAWEREGSVEIIGPEFNFKDTAEVARFILGNNRSKDAFRSVSRSARTWAEKYQVGAVRKRWLELFFSLFDEAHSAPRITALTPREQAILDHVDACAQAQDYDSALAVLDEHIAVTKNSRSLLKSSEMYFRGLLSLDEKRLNRYLPPLGSATGAPKSVSGSTSDAFLLVRERGTTQTGLTLGGIDKHVVDIDPTLYLRHASVPATDAIPDFGPDYDGFVSTAAQGIRFDRWVELHKSRIIKQAVDKRSSCIVTHGHWWIALPAVLAADQLGLRCAWLIDSPEDIADVREVRRGAQTSNYVAQTACDLFDRVDVAFMLTHHVSPELPFANLSFTVGPRGEGSIAGLPQIAWHHVADAILDSPSTRQYRLAPRRARDLNSFRIAAIAPAKDLRRLSTLVAEVVEIPVKDPTSVLSPTLDAVIIDLTANESDPWKGRLATTNNQRVQRLAQICDEARVHGLQTIVIDSTMEVISSELFGLMRKADVVCTRWMSGLTDLLTLHPTSIRSLSPWLDALSADDNLILALRAAGFPVALDSPLSLSSDATSPSAHSDIGSSVDDNADRVEVQLPDVTVIVETTDEQDLEQILGTQSLPQTLYRARAARHDDGSDITDLTASTDKLRMRAKECSTPFVLITNSDSLSNNPRLLEEMWINATPYSVVVKAADEPLESGDTSTVLTTESTVHCQAAIAPVTLLQDDGAASEGIPLVHVY